MSAVVLFLPFVWLKFIAVVTSVTRLTLTLTLSCDKVTLLILTPFSTFSCSLFHNSPNSFRHSKYVKMSGFFTYQFCSFSDSIQVYNDIVKLLDLLTSLSISIFYRSYINVLLSTFTSLTISDNILANKDISSFLLLITYQLCSCPDNIQVYKGIVHLFYHSLHWHSFHYISVNNLFHSSLEHRMGSLLHHTEDNGSVPGTDS